MSTFLRQYIGTALWSSTDTCGEPLDYWATLQDIAPETLREMASDCLNFRRENRDDLIGMDEGQGAHDFWLTRNGHRARFWDRGLGAVGDRLTDAAHVYGGTDLYVGDDGLIYAS